MIISPDLDSTRSFLADWLEIRAILSPHGAGQSDIAGIARLASDHDRGEEFDESGDIVDEEIAESGLEELLDRIAEEIDGRALALGQHYPFIVSQPFHLRLKGGIADLSSPHTAYLFLLLMSGHRDKRFPEQNDLDSLVRGGRTLFHACASIGVAGLLRKPNTIWFGWPRNDRTSFLSAIAKMCDRIGCGKAKTAIPPGYPSHPKDDQVDVVGWRTFGDQRTGNLVILCQAATGSDWAGKSILTQIEAFRMWFEIPPYAKATGAIAIPFPAHHEVSEDPESGFALASHNALDLAGLRLGVLIDRARIVEAVEEVTAESSSTNAVDGASEISTLRDWVASAIAAIQTVA